jgi:hypothetical protein
MAAKSAERNRTLDMEGWCVRFMNSPSVSLAGMAPNGALASSGVCLAAPGREYVAYSQEGGQVTIDLAGLAGTASTRFYNPRTGESAPGPSLTGGAKRTLDKPDKGDWVVHIVKQAG